MKVKLVDNRTRQVYGTVDLPQAPGVCHLVRVGPQAYKVLTVWWDTRTHPTTCVAGVRKWKEFQAVTKDTST